MVRIETISHHLNLKRLLNLNLLLRRIVTRIATVVIIILVAVRMESWYRKPELSIRLVSWSRAVVTTRICSRRTWAYYSSGRSSKCVIERLNHAKTWCIFLFVLCCIILIVCCCCCRVGDGGTGNEREFIETFCTGFESVARWPTSPLVSVTCTARPHRPPL